MNEKELKEIADNADMIVNNYAFKKNEYGVRVLNLSKPTSAMLISEAGELLETNMDEIEQIIVLNIWKKDKEYMEKYNA